MNKRVHLVGAFFGVFGKVMWDFRSIYIVLFGLIALGGFVVGQVENLAPGDGFYFAMVTGLTIGYGDITPITWTGRAIALGLGAVGIILTGLMVATAVFSLHNAWALTHPDDEPPFKGKD